MITLNLKRIPLDRSSRASGLLDLLEKALKCGFVHAGFEDDDEVLTAAFLSSDFHFAGQGGVLRGGLLTAAREVLALRAPAWVG